MDKEIYDRIFYAYKNYRPLRDLYDNNNIELSEDTDFASLPYMDKSLLSKYGFSDLFAVPIEKISRIFTSSGTTGEKHFVAFTENDWNMQAGILAESFLNIGIGNMDIFYDSIPKSPIFGGHIAVSAATRVGAAVIPAGKMELENHIKLINATQPTIINGISFFVLKISENLSAEIRSKVRIILLVGEYLYPQVREKIKALYPFAQVYSGYGISEIAPNNECTDHTGFHYDPSKLIVEISDCDENGVGEITFTSLFSEAMPLVRYKTGDIGFMFHTPCRCGCSWPKINVLGRKDNMINIKGKLIDKDLLKKIVFSEKGIKFAYCKYYPLEDSRLELIYTGDINEDNLLYNIKSQFNITPKIIKSDSINVEQWKTSFITESL